MTALITTHTSSQNHNHDYIWWRVYTLKALKPVFSLPFSLIFGDSRVFELGTKLWCSSNITCLCTCLRRSMLFTCISLSGSSLNCYRLIVCDNLRAELIDKGSCGNEKKNEEMVTECEGFGEIPMTFPSISVKIIASASVYMRMDVLAVKGESERCCTITNAS